MRVFILEDDSLQSLRLQQILASITDEVIVQSFKKPEQLLAHVSQPAKDNVYLLDIEIGKDLYSGFETSQLLRSIDNLGTIIFVTTHSEFMRKTYEYRVAALDFIDKIQIDTEIRQRLLSDFRLIKERQALSVQTKMIDLESENDFLRLPISDIYFFETIDDFTKRKLSLYTKSQHLIVKGNLKLVEAKSERFMRVHRSFVANIDNVIKLDRKKRQLYFNDNTYCLVSRSKLAKLREILQAKFIED